MMGFLGQVAMVHPQDGFTSESINGLVPEFLISIICSAFAPFFKSPKSTVLGEEESISVRDASVEDCGIVGTAIITRDYTILTEAGGKVDDRVEEVKDLMDKYKNDTFKVEQLKKRLGKLTGSIANIKVGGASETEQTETKYRIEDALNATKSAIEDGIVAGGGTALLRTSVVLKDKINKLIKKDNYFENEEHLAGWKIVAKAITKPCHQIMVNAGLPADAIVSRILESDKGYNALIQNSPLIVYRDKNKDNVLETNKNEEYIADIESGINIHRAHPMYSMKEINFDEKTLKLLFDHFRY
jgi:chaperonin GroEL (HSP60 family)